MQGIYMSNIFAAIIMLCQFASSILVYFIAQNYHLPYGINQIFFQSLSFGIPVFLYKALTRQKFSYFIKFKKISFKNFCCLIVLSVCIQPLIMLISSITSIFFNNTTTEVINTISNDSNIFSLVFILAVVPAFFEEISMRSVISQCLENIDFPMAAVICGFYFAIIHLNLQQFPYAFFMGVVLWILYNATGSILAPMISHFLINFTQVMIVNFNIIEKIGHFGEKIGAANLSWIIISFIAISFIVFFKTFESFLSQNPIKKGNNEKIPFIKIISPSFLALMGIYLFYTVSALIYG